MHGGLFFVAAFRKTCIMIIHFRVWRPFILPSSLQSFSFPVVKLLL